MKPTRLRLTCAAVGALLLSSPPAAHAADLSGVWKIITPSAALRTEDGKAPPLLPAALADYKAHKAAKARGDLSWDTAEICKPPGEPRILSENAWPFEIVQTANRVEFLYQWNHLVRFVPLQDKQDSFNGPWYFGQSVGHFEGDSLLIDDVGVSADTFLDSDGMPHIDSIHLTENFTLRDGGKILEARIRVEDPTIFSQPWTTLLRFARQPAGSVSEDVCETRQHQEARYPTLPEKLYPK